MRSRRLLLGAAAILTVVSISMLPVGPAAAQPATTPASASESKVQPPATKIASPTASADAVPGWWARQWSAIQGWFGTGVERGRAPSAPKGNAPPPAVTVSQPLVKPLIDWDEYTGRFDAVDTIEVRARVSGFLTEVSFVDGQMVKKGDRLFTIDARPFERALATARAELQQAKTKVENTRKDVERGRPLLDRRVISEKSYDDRENLLRDAEAAVQVAEAKMKTAELDLSFTQISAPLTGRISRNLISVGNYVTGGGSGTQTLLTTIVTQDPVQFYFDVSEANAIKYRRLALSESGEVGRPGSTIEIGLFDDKGFPYTGKIDFNDNRLDAATGTLRMRGVLDNPHGLFAPGMFGRARIAGSTEYKAVLVPDSAIGTDQASKFVAVVGDDGTVTRKVVTLGPLADGMRVVRSGATADDWLIVKGLQRARPGVKVNAKREPLTVAQPAAAAVTVSPAAR